jgi:hypothetical protein
VRENVFSMPSPISVADTLLLLRKVQEEAAPVELIGRGQGEQAIVLIGFIRADEGDDQFSVFVPDQISIALSLDKATLEYSEPREAPPDQRKRAQRLLQFMIQFTTEEWNFILRVWKPPDEVKPQ